MMLLNLGVRFEFEFERNLLYIIDGGLLGDEEDVEAMLLEQIGTGLEFEMVRDMTSADHLVAKFKEPGSLEIAKLCLSGV
jgi:hypothetical protein